MQLKYRDEILKLWINTKTSVIRPDHHSSDQIFCIDCSPDGKHFACSCWNEINIYEIKTKKPVGQPMIFHRYEVYQIKYSPNGELIMSCGRDGTVRIWQSKSQTYMGTVQKAIQTGYYSSYINSVAFSLDGCQIVSGGSENIIRISNTIGKELVRINAHKEEISYLSFSRNGHYLISSGLDATIRYWNIRLKKSPKYIQDQIIPLQVIQDKFLYAYGSHDRKVRIRNHQTDKIIRKNIEHTGPVNSVAFSPDSKTLVSGSDDMQVILWDLYIGSRIFTLKDVHTDRVTTVSFSTDGRSILSGSWDGTIKITERILI